MGGLDAPMQHTIRSTTVEQNSTQTSIKTFTENIEEGRDGSAKYHKNGVGMAVCRQDRVTKTTQIPTSLLYRTLIFRLCSEIL